eukprot:TRINITY_DN49_c0_g1_i2.p1 TRINITY_DN49_c0_g1~~TRINITY_DN49_c0_g1_i2.p1  ORF type:complete len:758 (-),score=492.97 TRINITY_DN49_c0_g1_i2:68-2341(-)
MLPIEEVFCEVVRVRNRSLSTQIVSVYLPDVKPQFRLAATPLQFRLAAGAVKTITLRVRMLCTTKQKVTIRVGTEHAIADLPSFKLESELSTVLDFDELRLLDRIGEGSFGVVYRAAWRKQPVAVKLLRQQLFTDAELGELREEAKFLSQLRHKNIVEFRGAVFREQQCCLVTECAPHGSLKSVIEAFSLPWDLSIKFATDCAAGVQFLHSSGILHRDIKSENVLVYSLSATETTCAKLTDFGSARNAKAHIDASGHVMLGDQDRARSMANGTPIYMAPQLFQKTARPSEASDCFALGVLFYEIASEREPWLEIAFAWDVAKAVVAGRRPAWPAVVADNAPGPFLPLVHSMWAQLPADRPHLDDVLERLAECQEAIGDAAGAHETRRNLRDRDATDISVAAALHDAAAGGAGTTTTTTTTTSDTSSTSGGSGGSGGSGSPNSDTTEAYASKVGLQRKSTSNSSKTASLGAKTASMGKRSSLGAISFSSLDDGDDDPDAKAAAKGKGKVVSGGGSKLKTGGDEEDGAGLDPEAAEMARRAAAKRAKKAAKAKAAPLAKVAAKNRSLEGSSSIESGAATSGGRTQTSQTSSSDVEAALVGGATSKPVSAGDGALLAKPKTKGQRMPKRMSGGLALKNKSLNDARRFAELAAAAAATTTTTTSETDSSGQSAPSSGSAGVPVRSDHLVAKAPVKRPNKKKNAKSVTLGKEDLVIEFHPEAHEHEHSESSHAVSSEEPAPEPKKKVIKKVPKKADKKGKKK